MEFLLTAGAMSKSVGREATPMWLELAKPGAREEEGEHMRTCAKVKIVGNEVLTHLYTQHMFYEADDLASLKIASRPPVPCQSNLNLQGYRR